MKQYWAVIGGKMQGPFEIPELVGLHGFDANVSVFISGQDEWKEAIQFPAISRYLRTGELPDELQVSDAQARILPQNWREAIVATDVNVPDMKKLPTRSEEISHAQSVIKESLRGARDTSRKVVSVSAQAAKTRQAQKVLLLFLGLGLFRTYQPAADFLPTVLDHVGSMDAMTASPKNHKLRMPWHRLHKAPVIVKGAANTAIRAAAPVAPKAETTKIVESDSSPLPDGMVMKTVTTVTEVNGSKVFKTKTFVESPTKKKHK